MTSNINHRIAGLSGILSSILYILSIIGLQKYIAANLSDIDAFTQNMLDAHHMMLVYGWPGLFATLLMIPLIIALGKSQKSSSYYTTRTLFLVTLIGLAFILVGYLFHLALTYFYAPAFQGLSTEEKEAFGVVFKTTIGLQDMFWLAGDLFAFLGVGALMILQLRENLFPKWLLIFGTLACLAAASGSISFIPAFKTVPTLSLLFISGFALFTVWEMIAGFLLIKRA